jgi:methyltransferase OMS1
MSNTTQRILLGAGVYAAGTYAAYTYIAKTKAPMPQADDGVYGGCTCAFDRIANVYDERISMEETMLGYGLLRRWMMRHAKVRLPTSSTQRPARPTAAPLHP